MLTNAISRTAPQDLAAGDVLCTDMGAPVGRVTGAPYTDGEGTTRVSLATGRTLLFPDGCLATVAETD